MIAHYIQHAAGRGTAFAAPMLCLGYNETCGFWGYLRGCAARWQSALVDFTSPRLGILQRNLMIRRLNRWPGAARPRSHADPRFS